VAGTKPQTWDAVLAEHDPAIAQAARAVERVVVESLPDAVTQFDPGNGLLAIGTSLKMRDLLFAIIPHRAHVNLQLADGVDLPNSSGLIEGTGIGRGRRLARGTRHRPGAGGSPGQRGRVESPRERRHARRS
jgi:hypothetical protein